MFRCLVLIACIGLGSTANGGQLSDDKIESDKKITQSGELMKRIIIEDPTNLPSLIADFLDLRKFILIGEIHGTNEYPQFALGVIKALSKKGRKIVFATEIWSSEQATFDRFMKTGDKELLLESKLFSEDPQYGISSKAMCKLFKEIQRLDNLSIFCFDQELPELKDCQLEEGTNKRDYLMASNLISAYRDNPEAIFVVLSGGIHASLSRVEFNNFSINTMGHNLYTIDDSPLLKRDLFAIAPKYHEGASWCCLSDENISIISCGVHQYPNVNDQYSQSEDAYYFSLFKEVDEGYNALFFSKKITPSLPVKKQ